MITFAVLYWLVPRLWGKAGIWSKQLGELHFWTATIGIVLYTVSMWAAGVMEGLMWRAVDGDGLLVYPNFMDIVIQLAPFYWIRLVGGLLYLTGACLMAFNFIMTVMQPSAAPAGTSPQPAK